MKKYILPFLIAISISVILIGCTNKHSTQNERKSTTEEQNKSSSLETELQQKSPTLIEVNYNDCFKGFQGCAIFYNSDTYEYKLYNKTACEKQFSPCSTFKIISTLLGLENKIINSNESKMGYNGTKYPIEEWNSDLSLKEAFKFSCVWYYKKVIDAVGEQKTKETLDKLCYGNCDISQWNGSNLNPSSDINGFWLESSLKISPKEQVEVLAKIFDGNTTFKTNNIEITKQIMFIDKISNYSVFGKTGTGTNNAWFTGIIENGTTKHYFAVHLEDNNVSGKQAKEIALNIINKYYDIQ